MLDPHHGGAMYRTHILHRIGNGSLQDCASFHLAFEATAHSYARALVHRSLNCCDTKACIRACAWHGEENVLVLDSHVSRNAAVEYISSSSLHIYVPFLSSLTCLQTHGAEIAPASATVTPAAYGRNQTGTLQRPDR